MLDTDTVSFALSGAATVQPAPMDCLEGQIARQIA